MAKMLKKFDECADTDFVTPKQLLQSTVDAPGPLPISLATLWKLVYAGKFVAPTQFGLRASYFKVGEVREWLANQVKKTQACKNKPKQAAAQPVE